jgi:hypothetical protein
VKRLLSVFLSTRESTNAHASSVSHRGVRKSARKLMSYSP